MEPFNLFPRPIGLIFPTMSEMYATQSYYDGTGQGPENRTRWMQDSTARATLPDKVWNGVQSLPWRFIVRTVNGQVKLCFYPVEG